MASSIDLAGRRAVITGATGGIGGAVAHRLAEAGAALTLVARTARRVTDLADALGADAVPADVGDPADVRRVHEHVGDGVDILVNAAGSFDLAPVAETDPEMFDAMIHGNLRAPFLMTRALLPGMLERGSGHIVTIGSVAGRTPFPGNGAYSAAKFGVRGLHAVLALELRGSGVRSTLVEPAATDTGIWDPLEPDAREDLPGRADMLDPDAVADTVLFAIARAPEVNIPTVAVERS